MFKTPYFLITIIFGLVLVLFLFLLTFGHRNPTFDSKEYLATIGGDVGISQEEFFSLLVQKKQFLIYSKQPVSDQKLLEKEARDTLIQLGYIKHYAKNNNIKITDGEIIDRYKYVISNSKMSEKLFLEKIKTMYGIDKVKYLESIKNDLLAEKIQSTIKIPFSDWLNRQKNEVAVSYL